MSSRRPPELAPLRSRAEHARVNRQLAGVFRAAGARRLRIKLYEGVLPGWYLAAHHIWLVPHALANRYRNALGPGDPARATSASPSVQLNLALAPGTARPQARFLRDRDGGIWVAHSGTLGGRQPGISRAGFVEFLGGAGAFADVVIGDRRERLHVLGTFARPAPLLAAIARLVHAADAFRGAIAAGADVTSRARSGARRPEP